MLVKSFLNFFYRFMFLLFVCLNISGCHHVEIFEKRQPEMSELTKGENAFFQNNYRQAADIFSSILEKSKDPIIRNIALYDLACTKLISSKCDDDIIQGMKMLEKWRLSKKSDKHIENPLILVLAFQKILNFEEQERLKKMETDKKNDIFLKQQQKKIVEMKDMIKVLEHQILELENIDQDIQIKRKAN